MDSIHDLIHPADEPHWVTHAIWWQVYPLGFGGAPADAASAPTGPGSTFDRLIDWLDYCVELGASGVQLGPVFASETHGYDTVDFLRIDARLGDEGAFDRFVTEARQRGLRILLDGVFNHVGRGFDRFQQALDAPDSPASQWFHRLEGDADAGAPRFATFEGHDALVVLNHAEPAVQDFVAEVMTHWLDRGIDGWRLDVAYAVPADFWRVVLGRVRESHPDAYFVGEVIHGDYATIIAESTLDSLTQYETWKAIWNGIEELNFFELAHALERHNGYLQTFAPLTFVGNHDVTRIASQITDERHLAHAAVVLLTIGGTPSIYYGDEQGFRGIKEERFGGDDAVRPEFPSEGPSALAPDGWPIYHVHQELIGLRRRHPWLHRATTTQLELTNTGFVYEVRAGDERLVVALNLDDQPLETTQTGAVLAGAASVSADSVVVPPHGWVVLG